MNAIPSYNSIMEDLMNVLGVNTLDDAISLLNVLPVTAIPVLPLCQELPFEFKPKTGKKSVRFSDTVKEEVLAYDRSDNINPKECLPNVPDDISPLFCRFGGYITDTNERMILVENGHFNSSDKVNDKKFLSRERIISTKEKQKYIYDNYMETSDPVKYVSSYILTGGDDIIQHLDPEFIFDCITYMLELYEKLETVGTTVVVDYQNGVTISNKPGKDQRHILNKNISNLTSHLE